MIVISDTGPVISLLKAEQLDILKIFGEVIIPTAVFEELTFDERFKDEGEKVKNSNYIRVDTTDVSEEAAAIRLQTGLDYGESAALALVKMLKPDYFLVEDFKAKKYATEQNITSIGSLAVLGLAYNKGILNEDDIVNSIEKMKLAKRRISNELYKGFLDSLGINISKNNEKNKDVR